MTPSTASALAATLCSVGEDEYVRFAAHWLIHGDPASPEPPLTGKPIIDALTAATVALAAARAGLAEPRWTRDPARFLSSAWHAGGIGASPRWIEYSRSHAPSQFLARGILVDADSLVSV